MKRLIRKIINWAYGIDISAALLFLEEAQRNNAILIKDAFMRRAIKDDFGIKEEELNLDKIDYK